MSENISSSARGHRPARHRAPGLGDPRRHRPRGPGCPRCQPPRARAPGPTRARPRPLLAPERGRRPPGPRGLPRPPPPARPPGPLRAAARGVQPRLTADEVPVDDHDDGWRRAAAARAWQEPGARGERAAAGAALGGRGERAEKADSAAPQPHIEGTSPYVIARGASGSAARGDVARTAARGAGPRRASGDLAAGTQWRPPPRPRLPGSRPPRPAEVPSLLRLRGGWRPLRPPRPPVPGTQASRRGGLGVHGRNLQSRHVW
ncbi:uncharacterized protein [Vulpes vulpes]|uniref:Basic proline-rich protein-like n=1 Tax=Vulpes vulpes TaxID=9627 RepID=A0ABM5APG8_VULVU